MTTPYKDAALRYMSHGWKGPLPVGTKPKQKTHPPTGYTGNEGIWPTEDQIAEWVKVRPNVNIGLRLPEHIIAIDVDDYNDKPGADTMVATTKQHGLLPRTWISTSREGHSGIRWFRLSNPGVLPGKLVHPDDQDMSGVEIIQHTHRYAIVPPSIHPEGGKYRWIEPDGTISDNLPRPSNFPMIPQSWVDHIRQDCSCWAPYQWDEHTTEPTDPVANAYRKWAQRMTESYGRHDAALGGAMALTAFKDRGWPGAGHHLEQLQADFYLSLGESRNPKEAEAEWQRMIEGAEKKASTTRIPQWQPRTTSQPSTPDTFDARVEEELDKLRVRDIARRMFQQETYPPQPPPPILTLKDRLAKPYPPVTWRIEGWQPIGTRVLLAAQFKAGKTTLTGNLARCLVDNQPWLGTSNVTHVTGNVTITDLEMGERQIDDWLRDQGIEHDHKVYVIPLRGRAGTFNILDDTIRKEWVSRLKGTEYFILDCLRPILDALGLDEHREAGRFLTAFDTLCQEAEIADSLIVHHMGHQGERSRGDSRLRDWPDVEWRLVRENEDPASPRYISAYGRDVDQSEAEIQHDPVTRHLTLIGGSRATAEARTALPVVLEMLQASTEPLTGKRIEFELAETDHTRSAIRKAVEIGIRNGQIHVEIGPRNARLHTFSSPVRRSSPQFAGRGQSSSPFPLENGEVETDLETTSSSPTCSDCQHPIPGAHHHWCPTLKSDPDPDDLPNPYEED